MTFMSTIKETLAWEEQELAGRTALQINELAAECLDFRVLAPAEDVSPDAIVVRRPDGVALAFDPMNVLDDAIRLAAYCRLTIAYKSGCVSDGFLRKEPFSNHGGDSVKTTCVYVTKRAAVRALNRRVNKANTFVIPLPEDAELQLAWASLKVETSSQDGWEYRHSGRRDGAGAHCFFNQERGPNECIVYVPASADWQPPSHPTASEADEPAQHA